MDADALSGIVLGLVFAAVGFYALYLVVRAAVRDGIKLARNADTAKDTNKTGDRT